MDDRRRVGLELTEQGARVHRSARSRRTAWLAARLERLPAEELAAVDAAITSLSRLLEDGRVTKALLRANRRTFVSLRRHRNYRLFFAGQVISVSGTWMQNIATAWLILTLTHSPLVVGLLAVCQFLPFTVFGLFAGVVVDRMDARRAVIWTQAVSMAIAGVLTGLTLAGRVTTWEVLLLAGLRGTVLVLDAPARQALTFEMVGRDELPNAVALNSSLFNAARVVGPAAGGVLVALAGVGACFAINTASFAAVLAGLLMMRVDELFPRNANAERPTLLRGTGEVFRYVRSSPPALLALTIVAVVSTISFNFNVLLPVLARQTLTSGPGTFGILTAVFGGGALAGALTVASLRPGQLAGAGDRHLRLRSGPAGAGPGHLADRRLRAAVRGRAVVHAVVVDRQLAAAAERARTVCAGG